MPDISLCSMNGESSSELFT